MFAKILIFTAASEYFTYYCVLQNEESKMIRQGFRNAIQIFST